MEDIERTVEIDQESYEDIKTIAVRDGISEEEALEKAVLAGMTFMDGLFKGVHGLKEIVKNNTEEENEILFRDIACLIRRNETFRYGFSHSPKDNILIKGSSIVLHRGAIQKMEIPSIIAQKILWFFME